MKPSKVILLAVFILLIGCIALAVWYGPRSRAPAPYSREAQQADAHVATAESGEKPIYVGRAACASCHQSEDAQWRGSHHDLAMQEATPATVLGDFNNATFTYHNVTTTFYREGDQFLVRTDGPDGQLHEYRVAYTFGIDPLQQYLVEMPGGTGGVGGAGGSGRYQALNICWDTRPRENGSRAGGGGRNGKGEGQRWFHLYPNENITSDDILHWTGPYQNWNHMCAECHSTNVHKNYDPAADTFNTTWSELDVSCEACHGPGSNHVAWARSGGAEAPASNDNTHATTPSKGLVARLREDTPGFWLPDPTTGIAKRDRPRTSHAEIETCARCHSRRAAFSEDAMPGRPPADTHRLALLEPALYEADGQILDEDYEYGSFVQSRMHAAGVTCSDCHNPHSLKPAPGNASCARCHAPDRFDTAEHHFHAPGGKGSACVECHMPTRTYMVVHERHDHSMRVPRPDLTVSIGTPNACNGCHADQTPQWAADEIARRTPGKSKRPHFGEAIAAGRRGLPEADALLVRLLADAAQPAIARATAAQMLAESADQRPLIAALADPSPIVRAAAAGALNAPTLADLARPLVPLLNDPVRQVRMDVARRLVSLPDSQLSQAQRSDREGAMREYLAALSLDADRAEARLNLGALHAERGDPVAAEREYLAARRLSPHFPGTYVNLADLYRQLGRDDEAIRLLREGSAQAPESADLPHAMGLALVRAQRLDEALPQLERAATLAPDVTRYSYVYGVALETAGPPGRGIDVLKKAHDRRPNDAEVLSALVAYRRLSGHLDDAMTYAARLAALHPNDPSVRAMLDQLKAERDARTRSPAPPDTGAKPDR